MRVGARRDRRGAHTGLRCRACGRVVPIDDTGRCPLGHHVVDLDAGGLARVEDDGPAVADDGHAVQHDGPPLEHDGLAVAVDVHPTPWGARVVPRSGPPPSSPAPPVPARAERAVAVSPVPVDHAVPHVADAAPVASPSAVTVRAPAEPVGPPPPLPAPPAAEPPAAAPVPARTQAQGWEAAAPFADVVSGVAAPGPSALDVDLDALGVRRATPPLRPRVLLDPPSAEDEPDDELVRRRRVLVAAGGLVAGTALVVAAVALAFGGT